MRRLWQLGVALVLVTGLAGCGVAVDQRTLQTKAAPAQAASAPAASAPATSAPATSAQKSSVGTNSKAMAAPVAAAPPTTGVNDQAAALTIAQTPAPEAPAATAPSPEIAGIQADSDDTSTDVDSGLEIAGLAPSVATGIDELLKSAAPSEPRSPSTTSPPSEPAEDDGDMAAIPAPNIPSPVIPSPVIPSPATGDTDQKDEPNAVANVVGDIIWNLDAANRARPTPAPEPQIPVGPDPSLASDALEAAFAQIARREHTLPDDVFKLPPKAPGTTRIALLIPVTGPNAALGAELQNGAELALFSVRNPKIELLVLDTHGDGPEAAASQAVVARADIVIGPLFSDAVVSARRIAQQANIPMLALSNNLKIAGRGSWLLGYVPEQQVDILLGYALTTGRNRVGIITEDAPFGQILARHAVDRLAQFGLRPVESLTLTGAMLEDEDQLKSAIRNFTGYQPPAEDETAPAFADLPPSRFDALLFAGSAGFALRTAPVLAYYDADPERVLYLGNAQWNQQRILTEPSLQGSVFASRPTGRDDAFNSLWSDVWPSRPGALARLSFDAMAMATVLTGQQRQLWQAALESESGFSGFSGAYRLLPGGGNQRAFELRRIENGVSTILQPAPDKI